MTRYSVALMFFLCLGAHTAWCNPLFEALLIVFSDFDSQSLADPSGIRSVNKSFRAAAHAVLRKRVYYKVSDDETADFSALLRLADEGQFGKIIEFDASKAHFHATWDTDEMLSNFSLLGYFRRLHRLILPDQSVVDIAHYRYKLQDVHHILWGTWLGQIPFLEHPTLRFGEKIILPPIHGDTEAEVCKTVLTTLREVFKERKSHALAILPVYFDDHWLALVIEKTQKTSETHIVFGYLDFPNRVNSEIYKRLVWELQRGTVTPVDHFRGLIMEPPVHDEEASGPVTVECILSIFKGQKIDAEYIVTKEKATSARWRHLAFIPSRSIK